MRELLAEVHHRAWLATAVAGGLAVASAALRLPLPAAMAAMAAPRGSAVPVREWTNPFPVSQPTRRQRQQGRRAGGRRQGGA